MIMGDSVSELRKLNRLEFGMNADQKSLVKPFGRVKTVRPDFWEPEIARKYWEWTEEQIRPYIY